MIRKLIFNKIINNTFLIYILFLISLGFSTYIYCTEIVKLYPNLIDEKKNYNITGIGFFFNEIIESILIGNKPVNTINDIDFFTLRMPALPYFLAYTYLYITKNFLLIHLFKNFLFGSILFFIAKSFDKKLNNLFLIILLILIFYNPHNLITSLSTNFEEGWSNYLIPTTFILLCSNIKNKSILLSISLSFLFFLKASLFYLSFGLALIYFFIEKKKNYLPILTIIICSLSWGMKSYVNTGKFAFGPKNTSLNGLTTGLVFHKKFQETYPMYTPDMHWDLVWEEIKKNKKNISNEWDASNLILEKSLKYIYENPIDILLGVYKKIYILTLSPFKDTLIYDENIKNPENKIRYSNIPNKIIFLISIIFLFKSFINLKSKNLNLKTLNVYYFFILVFYLFPYISVFIYGRHCTTLYILSYIYLIFYFLFAEKNNKIKKILIKN